MKTAQQMLDQGISREFYVNTNFFGLLVLLMASTVGITYFVFSGTPAQADGVWLTCSDLRAAGIDAQKLFDENPETYDKLDGWDNDGIVCE